jgi:hypothetical protein
VIGNVIGNVAEGNRESNIAAAQAKKQIKEKR